jgi:Fe-Mn family superoxide dismutase
MIRTMVLVVLVVFATINFVLCTGDTLENRVIVLDPLPYAYNALEPFIDTTTMFLHHTAHLQASITNLNLALDNLRKNGYIQLLQNSRSIQELLGKINQIQDEKLRVAFKNSAGGYVNHVFFWDLMRPIQKFSPPTKRTINKLSKAFGSFDNFKQQFTEAATKLFGSGWTYLIQKPDGSLAIQTFPNQDSPYLTPGVKPILPLDVFEHAYYLKHQSKRPRYIEDWWNIVNWAKVDQLLYSS